MSGKTNSREPGSRWEHFHHMADIGVRGYGSTLEGAFEQAALALTGIITDPALVAQDERVTVTCEAPDHELLLADWLNGLIYEMATRSMLFSRFEVTIKDLQLIATAWGEKVDVKKHAPTVETKGATYTALKVGREANNIWIAQCVVDV